MKKTSLLAAAAFGLLAVPALAEDAPKGSWASTITWNAQIEAGITGNFASPSNKLNFGQLFTDRANQPLLNQGLFTVARAIDPKETGYDIGFKLQGMYGADARYTRFVGILGSMANSRNQFDLVEANVIGHLPWFTEGGVDVKAGFFSSPMGAETIDPSTNSFYSHSYIFNFGLPLKQTGAYATVHATGVLDFYVGMDTGVNTSVFKAGDNNSSLAAMFGFGLNLMDGKLTVLALTHAGAENPSRTTPNANNFRRYLNDVVVTYKATDKLTLITELNYARDDFGRAEAWGIAQYAGYALTDTLTLNARAEIFRDSQGFFVGAYPSNNGPLNAEMGLPTTILGGTRTTYGSFTIGATYKPSLPAPIAGLLIRPELRFDRSLNGTKPYKGGRDAGSITLATDVILQF